MRIHARFGPTDLEMGNAKGSVWFDCASLVDYGWTWHSVFARRKDDVCGRIWLLLTLCGSCLRNGGFGSDVAIIWCLSEVRGREED